MQISKSFLLICTMSCTALLPLRAAEPAAQPSAAPAALPAADSESIAKAREALRLKMKEAQPKPTAAKPAKAMPKPTAAKPAKAQPKPTASKPEVKPAAEKAPKSPAAVKAASAFQPIQAPPPTVSADKQQRLTELLRKYKAEEFTPEEYHQQRSKILNEP